MVVETEAKLLLSAEKQAKLLASTDPAQVNQLFDRLLSLLRFGGYAVTEPQRITNSDKYFDTPKEDLHTDGNLLRVREGAGSYLLTIKKRNRGSNGVMEREEVETQLTPETYKRLKEEGFLSELSKHFHDRYAPVHQVAEVITDRLQVRVCHDGVSLKFCLDVAASKGKSIGVELEIEGDSPTAAPRIEPIRDAIVSVFPEFTIGKKSKFDRATELRKNEAAPHDFEGSMPKTLEEAASGLLNSLWKKIQSKIGAVGAAILLFLVLAWWMWGHIKDLPGVSQVIRLTSSALENLAPLPQADPQSLNVAIAILEDDSDQVVRKQALDTVSAVPGVVALRLDRTLPHDEASSKDGAAEVAHVASELLKTTGANVLIWGRVIQHKTPQLYWVTEVGSVQPLSAGTYVLTPDGLLPQTFRDDLLDVLTCIVFTSDSRFEQKFANRGAASADELKVYIERARTLVSGSASRNWNTNSRAKMLSTLGVGLTTYGDQMREQKSVRDGIGFLHEAISLRPRTSQPTEWATSERHLGVALEVLGGLTNDLAMYTESIECFRSALKELRSGSPEWVDVERDLGTALTEFGQFQPDPKLLIEAATTLEVARSALDRNRDNLKWLTTSSSLAVAKTLYAEGQRDLHSYEQAADIYRDLLAHELRDRNQTGWSGTQHNLGLILTDIGKGEAGTSSLNAALQAFDSALDERTKARALGPWMESYLARNTALAIVGSRTSDRGPLKEATINFRKALEQIDAAKQDLGQYRPTAELGLVQSLIWISDRDIGAGSLDEAMTLLKSILGDQKNPANVVYSANLQGLLGAALLRQAQRAPVVDKGILRRAQAAYQQAMADCDEGSATAECSEVANGLGRAFLALALKDQSSTALRDAQQMHSKALKQRPRSNAPYDWAETMTDVAASKLLEAQMTGAAPKATIAIEILCQALVERPRDKLPLQWAESLSLLGDAHEYLGVRTKNKAMADEANANYEASLAIFKEGGIVRDIERIKAKLESPPHSTDSPPASTVVCSDQDNAARSGDPPSA